MAGCFAVASFRKADPDLTPMAWPNEDPTFVSHLAFCHEQMDVRVSGQYLRRDLERKAVSRSCLELGPGPPKRESGNTQKCLRRDHISQQDIFH